MYNKCETFRSVEANEQKKMEQSHIDYGIFKLAHFNDKYNHPLEKKIATRISHSPNI